MFGDCLITISFHSYSVAVGFGRLENAIKITIPSIVNMIGIEQFLSQAIKDSKKQHIFYAPPIDKN